MDWHHRPVAAGWFYRFGRYRTRHGRVAQTSAGRHAQAGPRPRRGIGPLEKSPKRRPSTDKLLVDSALASAVSQFANNPTIGGKALRALLNANPDKFFQNAIPLLKCPEEEPGVNYVLVLLISHG